MERAKVGRPLKNQSHQPTGLSALGISRDQSADWQRLARRPHDAFGVVTPGQAASPVP
jgi:hypothetical protein